MKLNPELDKLRNRVRSPRSDNEETGDWRAREGGRTGAFEVSGQFATDTISRPAMACCEPRGARRLGTMVAYERGRKRS
jgi:hypothetical protein